MSKNTFERNKPHWSFANSMMSSWMRNAKDIPDITTDKLLQVMDWSSGKHFPILPTLDTENSEDNEDGTYAVQITFPYNASNLAESGTDQIWYIVYNDTTKYINCLNSGNTRADGLALVDIQIPAAGDTYIAFFATPPQRGTCSTQQAIAKLSSAGVLSAIEP